MGHHHRHGHTHAQDTVTGRNLGISIVLNVMITVAQLIGGILSGSLSLLSDAVHNFSDVLSLIVSYIANRLAKKSPTKTKTFGYKRAEIVAAFVNAAALMIVAILLIKEAITRILAPQDVVSDLVIGLSLLGILVNGFSVLLLQRDAKANMNMRSAYLHLLTDMMASFAVLIGGLFMKFFQWYWIDPMLTLLIAVYLIVMGYRLFMESLKVLMLFVPHDLPVETVAAFILQNEKVNRVYHVHLWPLTEHDIHFEAHINFKDNMSLSEFEQLQEELETGLKNTFGITHVTIQPQFNTSGDGLIFKQE